MAMQVPPPGWTLVGFCGVVGRVMMGGSLRQPSSRGLIRLARDDSFVTQILDPVFVAYFTLAEKLGIMRAKMDRTAKEVVTFVFFGTAADAELGNHSALIKDEVIVMRPSLSWRFLGLEFLGDLDREFFGNDAGHFTFASG